MAKLHSQEEFLSLLEQRFGPGAFDCSEVVYKNSRTKIKLNGNPNVFNPDHINKNNKKKFRDLYNSTLDIEEEVIKQGYKLVTIWENEFDKMDMTL